MVTANQLIDVVRDYLDSQEWNYDFDAERMLLRSGLTVKNRMKSVKIYVNARDGILQSFFVSAVNGDTNDYMELLKFLNYANWNMTSGNFEFDPTDGEIRFRYSIRLGDINEAPESLAEAAIVLPAMMYEKYGDSIATLAFGFSNAEDEIAKIKKAEEEEE